MNFKISVFSFQITLTNYGLNLLIDTFFLWPFWYFSGCFNLAATYFLCQIVQDFITPFSLGWNRDSNSRPLTLDTTCTSALGRRIDDSLYRENTLFLWSNNSHINNLPSVESGSIRERKCDNWTGVFQGNGPDFGKSILRKPDYPPRTKPANFAHPFEQNTKSDKIEKNPWIKCCFEASNERQVFWTNCFLESDKWLILPSN